jgi:hypothetical protein
MLNFVDNCRDSYKNLIGLKVFSMSLSFFFSSTMCLIMNWKWHKYNCVPGDASSSPTERPNRNEEEENIHSSTPLYMELHPGIFYFWFSPPVSGPQDRLIWFGGSVLASSGSSTLSIAVVGIELLSFIPNSSSITSEPIND